MPFVTGSFVSLANNAAPPYLNGDKRKERKGGGVPDRCVKSPINLPVLEACEMKGACSSSCLSSLYPMQNGGGARGKEKEAKDERWDGGKRYTSGRSYDRRGQ